MSSAWFAASRLVINGPPRFCSSSIKLVATWCDGWSGPPPCHRNSVGVGIAGTFYMRPSLIRAIPFIAACTIPAVPSTAASQDDNRRGLAAALETLIATGEPRHTTHDEGEWLQLAVDAAIARGDHEIERLAVRAASPLTVWVTRPVSSTADLPTIEFNAQNALRVPRPIAYTARIAVSVDNGAFVLLKTKVASGQSPGTRIDMLPRPAAAPGFHVVRLSAQLRFGSGASGWSETRTLPPLYYAIYGAGGDSTPAIQALVYRPASTPVREFDPLLGDEPFAAWLSDVLSTRSQNTESRLHWLSQYCDERTGEAGIHSAPTAICSVVSFALGRDIGQIWFRTAEIQETDQGIEWVPLPAPQFEAVMLEGAAQQRRLSSLPSLLATLPGSRPVGDVSITPKDIVLSPAEPIPGGFAATTVTVRNVSSGDLHKVHVSVTFGVDPATRGATRQFVVDIPAQQSVDLKLDVAFPNGYGFVMAHALQLTEHSPSGDGIYDPTPLNACAIRVVNGHLASATYLETLLEAAGGCNGR